MDQIRSEVEMKLKIHHSLWVSFGLLGTLLCMAILGETASPYDPLAMSFTPLQSPSFHHFFGTDNVGRDVFSRFVAGARISYTIGIVSSLLSCIMGSLVGLAAAYFLALRALLMRVTDAVWAFPTVLLGLALAASLKPGGFTVIIAISVVYSPMFTRLVYGQALSILERDYITAAKAFGCGSARLLLTHVLPNLAAPLIVQITLTVGTAIILESSLSFLGVGIQPPAPSWGNMLRTSYKWLEQDPWMSILPGLGIYFTVVSFSVIGDWLRVVLDPKQKQKRI
jgi:peptide/nickel transport system permease protein